MILLTSMTRVFNIVASLISNDVLDRYEEVLSDISVRRGMLQSLSCIVMIALFLLYLKSRGRSLSPSDISLIRVGIWFSISLLLGSLSTRASYFYDVFFLASVVRIFADKKAAPSLRFAVLFLTIMTSLYSMYVVWMGSPWWNHAVYHSLLGDW